MKGIFSKIKTLVTGHPYKTAIGFIVLVGIIFVGFRFTQRNVNEVLVKAERGTVKEEVSVTGRVVSAQNVDLAFEKTVKISEERVAVGDSVKAGDILLVSLNADSLAAVREARARVSVEEAKLAQVKRGSRSEEITISNTKVESGQQTALDALATLNNEITNAYTVSDDAIHNKVDQFMTQGRGPAPTMNILVNDYDLIHVVEVARPKIEAELTLWKQKIDSSKNAIPELATLSQTTLSDVSQFLSKVALVVNSLRVLENPTVSQATLDGYKTSVATARSAVTSALISLTSAKQTYTTAESSLTLTKRQSDLTNAGSTDEDIMSQEAEVEVARASLASALANYAKTIITAPFDGTVATLPVKVGEIIEANKKAISLISKSSYQIETNIPESDVVKLTLGNSALVTLDAYGTDAVFPAKVISIDPGETIIDGVSSYRTRLEFSVTDDRIRSGMTANVTITGNHHDNVIIIPARAVTTKDGKKTVTIKENNSTRVVSVTTGLRGSDGSVEITSGLSLGDTVVSDAQ